MEKYVGRPPGNGWNSPVNNAQWGTDYLTRASSARWQILALHALLLVGTNHPRRHLDATAEEGGSGHYMPGSMASFVDGVPPKETFIARYNFPLWDAEVDANRNLPIAGR